MNQKAGISEQRLHQLLKMTGLGWWKADFKAKHYICSEFIIELLGLSSDLLTFEEFRLMIRTDYRERITYEFAAIRDHQMYEQTFPIVTEKGELWVHSQLGEKETDTNGHIIAWGILQKADNPEERDDTKLLEKLNILLGKHSSISHTLLSFLKTDQRDEVVDAVLYDVLSQFHGERCYILEYDRKQGIQKYRHKVAASGIPSIEDKHSYLSLSTTPWWTQQIMNYKPVILYTLDEMPAEARMERQFFERQNVKSVIAIPLIARDEVWGFMGIDFIHHHHKFTQEDYQWFSAIGNIISICMELNKSERKAQQEWQTLNDLYQHMPMGYMRLKMLYDKDHQLYDYCFIEMNEAASRLTEKSQDYYLHHTARDIYPPDKLASQLKDIQAILNNEWTVKSRYEVLPNQKYYRPIVYSPAKDEIVTLYSDITENVRAHEAVNRSEKKLRNVYKNIPVGIKIYDKNGILLDINDKDMEIFGISDKQAVKGLSLINDPNVPLFVKEQLQNHHGTDFEIQYDFNKAKKYYTTTQEGIKDLICRMTILYDENQEIDSYLWMTIDNTEVSMAHHKVKEFEDSFSLIASFAKVGYFRWNIHKKKGFAVEQWFKNLGEPANSDVEDMISHYRMLHPDDRVKMMSFYDKIYRGERSSLKEELRVKDGKGGWKWIRSTVVIKEFDPEHRNTEIIGVNYDITELKEIEAKLLEAKNKAETLDKLKSAFLANMSHEIRTPLNAIVGFSHLLAETDEPAERKQYTSIIQENNELLLQLISDILDLSKIEAGTFDIVYGQVDVNVLCQEIVWSMSLKTPENVSLEFKDHLPECFLYSDRNRLMQVLTNFINNAMKFTFEGHIRLGYQVQGKEIEFYVSDTGIGIPQHKLQSVFERFVKLNSFVHGTGLGLSICKSMIEQMNGTIGVESEEGKGSRFWFKLPYIVPEQKKEETVLHMQTSSPVPVKTDDEADKPVLLIAEDTESNFILVYTILKKEYNILWAHNGKEAIELYKQNKPRLILMDIRMPEMDGLTATRHIRETDRETPIIALTAFAFDQDRTQSLEAGCNEYLTKPVQSTLLKSTIQKLLKG